jgi:hypothetical protein
MVIASCHSNAVPWPTHFMFQIGGKSTILVSMHDRTARLDRMGLAGSGCHKIDSGSGPQVDVYRQAGHRWRQSNVSITVQTLISSLFHNNPPFLHFPPIWPILRPRYSRPNEEPTRSLNLRITIREIPPKDPAVLTTTDYPSRIEL